MSNSKSTIRSAKDLIKDDFYENHRQLFESEVRKGMNDPAQFQHFVTDAKKHLESVNSRFKPLSDQELMTIGFFLEDSIINTSDNKDAYDSPEDYEKEMAKYVLSNFLEENYERNPEFFSLYFSKVPKRFTIKSQNKIADKPEEQVEEKVEPLVLTPEVFKELPTESFVDSGFDVKLASIVTELQEYRSKEIQSKISYIVEKIGTVPFSSKEEIISTLGETVLLKQIISSLFHNLKVSTVSTTFSTDNNQGVQERKIEFQPNISYSLSDYKNGYTQAIVKISSVLESEKQFNELKARITASDANNAKLNLKNSDLNSKIDLANQKYRDLESRPKIEDQKVLYVYITWSEIEDNKKITYYLGTSDEKSITPSNVYKVSTLVKTTKRGEGVKFKNVECAKLQLERSKIHYDKINRKQGISLDEHIKKAKLIQIIEYIS